MTAAEPLHASAVALDGRGLLILGDSGSGKSSLSLGLIARGARLVADDRTLVARDGERLMLSAPPPIAGLIEARGLGLIRLEARSAPLTLACRLGPAPSGRLPPRATLQLHGLTVPLLSTPYRPDLADALIVLLAGGRLVDPDGS